MFETTDAIQLVEEQIEEQRTRRNLDSRISKIGKRGVMNFMLVSSSGHARAAGAMTGLDRWSASGHPVSKDACYSEIHANIPIFDTFFVTYVMAGIRS